MGLMNKLKSIVNRLKTPGQPIDPSQFDDPLAEQIEWSPCKRGGANFTTHKLYETNLERLEFKPAFGAKIFYSIFLFVGLAVMFGPPISRILDGKSIWNGFETLFLLLFGLVFTSAGGTLLYFGTAPIVFDKRNGYFWKGRKSPVNVPNIDSIKHFAELDNIHALQIISEYCSGEDSSYYSYELNIVLADATRINVVDHGKISTQRQDAQKLANFLNVPLWDATQQPKTPAQR